MGNPLVTIIVMSYNHAKYIVENLDSIKNQTYKNIQLILVDDASSDKSVEVYENWLELNNYLAIKVFNQENIGLANSLNNCFKLIEGKYVKILAADDYLHSESIGKCVSELEKLGEEYGMVFSESWWVDKNSQLIEKKDESKKYSTSGIKRRLIKGNIVMALTALMKTEALLKTGLYDPDILTEDYDRWLRINERYLIAHLPEKLAYYRQHQTNISKIKQIQVEEENLMLKIKYDVNGRYKNIINKLIIRKYLKNKLTQKSFEVILNYPFVDVLIKRIIKNKIKPNTIIKVLLKLRIGVLV